jgi:hypothetical protein
MAATITWAGAEATIDGGEWTCADEDVKKLLETFAKFLDPLGYYPDRDAATAQYLADKIGAKIVKIDEPEPEPEGEEMVY